jgi:hypothetical protein
MGFHGLTPQDIVNGRQRADRDQQGINENATAAELARIASRFSVRMYPGIELRERNRTLDLVYKQALAQAAAALEQGAAEEECDYSAVAAMARETLDIMSFDNEIHEATEEQERIYNTLLRV